MAGELTRMSAAELAAAIAAGEVSALEVTDAHLDRIGAGGRRRCTPSCTSPRTRPAGPRGRSTSGGQPARRSARWPACRWRSRTSSPPPTCRPPAARRILAGWQPPYDATITGRLRQAGRGDPRQDQHGRVRDGLVHGELGVRPLAQPVGPDPGAGRLVRRLGGRGGRVPGAAGHRHRHRRVDPPAGRGLRAGRGQADLRRLVPVRAGRLRLVPGHPGPAGPHRAGRGAAARGHRPGTTRCDCDLGGRAGAAGRGRCPAGRCQRARASA